jgi:tetratricopeptide (TPR) repeat protein
MRNNRARAATFLGFTGVMIILHATVLAACWPGTLRAAARQSDKLVAEAGSVPPAEAAADYKLAAWLDSDNQPAYLGLARTQVATGKADLAIKTLEKAGQGSEAAQLRLRTLLELGRTAEAADAAAPLAQPGQPDENLLLAAVTYALAGRQADLPALGPMLSADGRARLARITAGGVPFATELYRSGLPESARATLVKLPVSFERNQLLARIHLDRHTKTDLEAASRYLEAAVVINPANIEAHQLLAGTYSDRGLTASAATQSELAAKLRAGRP